MAVQIPRPDPLSRAPIQPSPTDCSHWSDCRLISNSSLVGTQHGNETFSFRVLRRKHRSLTAHKADSAPTQCSQQLEHNAVNEDDESPLDCLFALRSLTPKSTAVPGQISTRRMAHRIDDDSGVVMTANALTSTVCRVGIGPLNTGLVLAAPQVDWLNWPSVYFPPSSRY